MVVMDSTTLLLLFFPSASPPIDLTTGAPVAKCKDRIDYLLQNLSEAGIKVMVPTPVLSELLVKVGPDKAKVLSEIHGAYAFKVEPFDTRAAIEVAHLTDSDLQSGKRLSGAQTYAKVKYDRQIIAIAKVNGITTIYSDDGGVAKRAVANGMQCVSTADLPLPPEDPQQQFALDQPAT
jgi:predicted nucleic acid-binding protein